MMTYGIVEMKDSLASCMIHRSRSFAQIQPTRYIMDFWGIMFVPYYAIKVEAFIYHVKP